MCAAISSQLYCYFAMLLKDSFVFVEHSCNANETRYQLFSNRQQSRLVTLLLPLFALFNRFSPIYNRFALLVLLAVAYLGHSLSFVATAVCTLGGHLLAIASQNKAAYSKN